MSRQTLAWFALGLLSGALLSVPLFLLLFGVAALLLAGRAGVALGVLVWLAVLGPLVRRSADAAERPGRAARQRGSHQSKSPSPM